MRWVVFLLCAASLATTSLAHGALEVAQIHVNPATAPAGSPRTIDSVVYPGRTLLSARLRGLEVGRTYGVGARLFDAKQRLVWRQAWSLTAKATQESLSLELEPPLDSEPGQWRLLFAVEGTVVERAIAGERRRQTAPLEVVQLVITPSIKVSPAVDSTGSRWDPAGELESISYPAHSIFFTRLRGLEPGRTYNLHVFVLDAQQHTAGERRSSYVAISTEGMITFDLMPNAHREPGQWRLVVEVDGRRIAERTIRAVRRGPFPPPLVNIAHPSAALASVEATELVVATHVAWSSDPAFERLPANDLPAIEYPLRTVFYARLSGLQAGRTYNARGLVLDARQQIAAEHAWTFVPKAEETALYFQLTPKARSEPGEWRLVVELDGTRIAERAIPAVRRGQPPAPPLKLVRSVITDSLDRHHQPRRALDILGLPSAVQYYVEASGFVRAHNYQVHITVSDGAGKQVDDHHFGRTAEQPLQVIRYPILPSASAAPGLWTFRMEIDDELVTEDRIEARPGRSQAANPNADLERWWPAVAAALALVALYVAYGLVWVSRAAVVPATVPARAPQMDMPLLVLIVTNLLPLAVAYYEGANAADLVFLYWCENLIVAGYAVLRMLTARGGGASALLLAGFFIVHFGMFTVVHGLFLYRFFADQLTIGDLSSYPWLKPELAAQFAGQLGFFDQVPASFAFALAALVASHGISFVHHYLRGGEYMFTDPQTEMWRPYARLGVMHVCVLAAGLLATTRGSPMLLLAFLVAVKTGVDAAAHIRSHARLAPGPA